MKIFKWIYYPAVAVLTVLMVVFGFLNVHVGETKSLLASGGRNRVDDHLTAIAALTARNDVYDSDLDGTNGVRKHIETALADNVDEIEKNRNSAKFVESDGNIVPTYYAATDTVSAETAAEMSGPIYIGREVQNLMVVVPGSVTRAAIEAEKNGEETVTYGDAVLLVANYDNKTVGASAADTAALASLIEVARETAQGSYKNDFVFLFSQGGEEGALGSWVFTRQFTGFNDIASRVKVALSFDAVGEDGALLLGAVNEKGENMVSALAKIGGKMYADSVYSAVAGGRRVTDFAAFRSVAAAGVTTLDSPNYGTAFDTADNVSAKLLTSMSNMQKRAVDYFGGRDLGVYDEAGVRHGFFDYLGGTISYAYYVPYIFAGLILLLAAGNVVLAVLKKTMNLVRALLGAAVHLITLAATLGCLYVAYFLCALIMSGFGVVDLHALGSVVFASTGLWIFAIIFGFALSVAFYQIFKKVFAVRPANVVNGNVFLLDLVAVIFCFAAPTAAHLFFIAALLESIVMTVTSFLSDRVKAKFGFNFMERLFLYAVPVILLLPVMCGEFALLGSVTPLIMLPLYVAAMLFFGGAIMPYAGLLRRPLEALAAALPPRTVRVYETVTVREEDPVKKGKFNEVEKRQIRKEHEPRTYRNAFGITVVAVISVVAAMLFSGFGGQFGKGYASSYSHYDEVYKDALVYVDDGGTHYFEVRDLDAYKYIARYVDGLDWNAEKGAYVREGSVGNMTDLARPTIEQDSENVHKFTVQIKTGAEMANQTIRVRLSEFGAGNITKVTFTQGTGDESAGEENVIDIAGALAERETLEFVMPDDYDDAFTIEVEGDAAENIIIEVEQRGYEVNKRNNNVFAPLAENYSADPAIYDNLRLNAVLRYSSSFPMQSL